MRTLARLAVLLAFSTTAFAAGISREINAENVLLLMNEERARTGLPALHLDANLSEAASDRMRDMEDGGWWSHDSPEGVSPFVWLRARGYHHAYAAENLARGFETVQLLVTSWMESPGHRENILDVRYSDCGIAIIEGSTQGPAAGKSIVVLFGRRKQ